MIFTNIAGATAILECNGKRMLFDPWLDDGIFHGSWFHWPPTHKTAAELGRFDYIYISHIHEDHCSADTIRHLNRDAEIIIMDRQPNFVANFLRSNGFNFSRVHLVPPRKGLKISDDLFVDMIEADPANEMAYIVDSSIVIRWGEHTIFNANDCQPHASGIEYLNNYYPEIDLALLPYSGGSGYPGCYVNLSDSEKESETDRILNLRIQSFISNTKSINPRFVVPFADQYVVGGSRSYLNRFISHGSCPGVVRQPMEAAGLAQKLVLLNSGQSFRLTDGMAESAEPYKYLTEVDRENYIREHLQDAIYDHERITFGASVAIDRLAHQARERLWVAQDRRKSFPDYQLILDFSVSNRRFSIDLRQPGLTEVRRDQEIKGNYLRVSGSDTLMIMLLMGHISWNIADAALFLDYERHPNTYDPSIYVLLNFLRL